LFCLVLNTHQHPDHTGGNEALKDLGMTGSAMFDRGVPGMCQELSQ
jgi:glyoxylase-like metal-dependent hydrolase (beta-lactamase superfamily II)